MRYCPICDERYDDDIIRFCTKDGTPLIEGEQPSFTALPSENIEEEDDPGEVTIIRRKPDMNAAPDSPPPLDPNERIVIPTFPSEESPVRPRETRTYIPPPQEPNTGKTVVLTILGTLAVLAIGGGLFWFLQKDTTSNINSNLNANLTNQNINLNTNLGFDSNFNFNSNSSFNANFDANFNTNFNVPANLNTNLKTPTPKPTPSATPTPAPKPTEEETPSATPTPRPTSTVRTTNTSPTPLGTPRTGPRPPVMTSNRPSNNNQ